MARQRKSLDFTRIVLGFRNMNRRTLLSTLGISVAGGFAGLSAITNSGSTKQTWVVSLESFRASHADQMPHLHSYLGGTFLPYLTQIHRGPKMFLDAIVAPHTPQALVLTAFPSFAEMIEIRGKIAAHPEIQRARADRECDEAQILITSADSFRFHAGPTRRRDGIFELRGYHAPTWRDRPPVAVNVAFRRAGIRPILTASAAGEHVPRFTFLVAFESLAIRQEAWGTLEADSEWSDLEAKVTSASIYKLAPYSPLS
jgi:hypothetical protein